MDGGCFSKQNSFFMLEINFWWICRKKFFNEGKKSLYILCFGTPKSYTQIELKKGTVSMTSNEFLRTPKIESKFKLNLNAKTKCLEIHSLKLWVPKFAFDGLL